MKPIGALVKEELDRQERTVAWFARKLSCDRSNIYRLMQKDSIDTGLLMRISKVLQHDFFSDLSRSYMDETVVPDFTPPLYVKKCENPYRLVC